MESEKVVGRLRALLMEIRAGIGWGNEMTVLVRVEQMLDDLLAELDEGHESTPREQRWLSK